MDYVMRRRSTVGSALELFSLPFMKLKCIWISTNNVFFLVKSSQF